MFRNGKEEGEREEGKGEGLGERKENLSVSLVGCFAADRHLPNSDRLRGMREALKHLTSTLFCRFDLPMAFLVSFCVDDIFTN